ncbi:glycosyltransferase family 2 protein [Thalassovita mediterranea]|jgi:hypothetical protein|uniref:Glycosyl transferase family 2 n=1 Tax=Thalassovita mediterranea TaxID=340021 RepID=A0A0P1GS91_9RHOB|nr:glycosyltransferase family 2 protein [Thalassovita mediterranea]CUH85593.1 hypothetical protein TM5383_02827 [Thalassovita mediterranea]SIS30126.1 Glycosyl transferase family 2 [Thalassovita mediterranea]
MSGRKTWGLVSTIKAPVEEVLNFCAHHLDLGAHRLFIYLDDDSVDHRAAFDLLSAHPKVRPLITDDAYWQKRGFKRRAKHQSRQFENAKHVYRRATGQVDWLTHIDVDEFLWPTVAQDKHTVADVLTGLSDDCQCARIRPWEALAPLDGGPQHDFKGMSIPAAQRRAETEEIYPDYGTHLNGGFLSHVAGKMFYRTGVEGMKVQIHNVWIGEDMNPQQQELPDLRLLHCHAGSWDHFYTAFHFRLDKGSYRSELRPNKPVEEGGVSLHDLLSGIYADGGEAALRRFYDTVCAADPDLIARLSAKGLHMTADLDLDAKRRRHFPDY